MKQETREKVLWMANAIHQALVTDDEGITKSVLGDVAHEIAKMYGKVELAHGCASTQETEKKRTNLEFCGLKLSRYSCDGGTLYVGTRDFRPCGEKQLWQIASKKDDDGDSVGTVSKNSKVVVSVSWTTLSMPMLERFMIGGLHAVLKRKERQNKKTHARRKAKRAAKRMEAAK